jgi:hypothetical protein
MGVGLLRSSPTMHQRMGGRAPELFDFAAPMIEPLLYGGRADDADVPCVWSPLDVGTFAVDNGGAA